MVPTVAQIAGAMERLAPGRLAESWDNVGLQVGDPLWPVERIWLALDPLPEVVAAAARDGAQMLITHHPLLFKPLASLDLSTPTGGVVQTALENRLAIFSAHTNLDSVAGGVNDILARRIGLASTEVLSHEKTAEAVKLTVFVPEEHESRVIDALVSAGAGRIGDYSGCTFRCAGKGTFVPGPKSTPYRGRPGEPARIDELRIETRVDRQRLSAVLAALRKAHPYETIAFDLVPLMPEATGQGLGRVGDLDVPRTLGALAESVRSALGLDTVRIVGDETLPVQRVALCSGSGGGLLKAVYTSGAQVYVSGDLRYHDARDAQVAGLGLIDIGHFAGEHLVLEPLGDRLTEALRHAGWTVAVKCCEMERDPFRTLGA